MSELKIRWKWKEYEDKIKLGRKTIGDGERSSLGGLDRRVKEEQEKNKKEFKGKRLQEEHSMKHSRGDKKKRGERWNNGSSRNKLLEMLAIKEEDAAERDVK